MNAIFPAINNWYFPVQIACGIIYPNSNTADTEIKIEISSVKFLFKIIGNVCIAEAFAIINVTKR